MILLLALVGALIGVIAAKTNGFSVVAGFLGGLLLGPLAVLMFWVTGVTRNDRNVKCPACAEFIKAEAAVCRYCGRDVGRGGQVTKLRVADARDYASQYGITSR